MTMAGFFFPLSRAGLECEMASLKLLDEQGQVMPLFMVDESKIFAYGHLLFELFPQQKMSLYVLPKKFDRALFKEKCLSALSTLVPEIKVLNDLTANQTRCYSYYCVYIGNDGGVKISRNDVRFKKGKFRDDSNYNSAFNIKNSVTKESLLIS